MFNTEQFVTICIQNLAITMAKPGMAGAKFTWALSFPKMAVRHIETQWAITNQSNESFLENRGLIQSIAEQTAKDFAEITGRP